MCIWPGTNTACFSRRSRWITTPPNCSDRSRSFRARRRSASRSGSRPAADRGAVELRVVPHRRSQHTGQQETEAELRRAGLPVAGRAMVAPPCPARRAHYFGTALDQPRVILKAFIPWHQLGLAGPPRRAASAARALGVTAFYRSRWMSRSGLAPEIAMDASGELAAGQAGRRGAGLAGGGSGEQGCGTLQLNASHAVRVGRRLRRPRHVIEADRDRRCGRPAGRRRASDSRRSKTRCICSLIAIQPVAVSPGYSVSNGGKSSCRRRSALVCTARLTRSTCRCFSAAARRSTS